ncbi:MAG: LuxR C-terminal-related transcriptional regulator, partial [Vicinamibacterales bacterium]
MSNRGARPDTLTPREREVLGLLRQRLTNEQIAQRLGITLDGAKYHVSQILSKLGVGSREEAAAVVLAERRWWLRAAVWAKLAGAATVTAAVVGLAVLAWGVVRTEGPEERSDTSFDEDPTPIGALSVSKILFAHVVGEGEIDFDIYTVDSDGSGLTNITNSPDTPEFFPAWSPNRRQVAFYSQEWQAVSPSPDDPKGTTSIQRWYLHLLDADGSDRRRLAEWSFGHDNIPPVWS